MALLQLLDTNLTPLTAQATANTSLLTVRDLLAAHLLVFAAPESWLLLHVHGTTHTIKIKGGPVFAVARRLPTAMPNFSVTSSPVRSGRSCQPVISAPPIQGTAQPCAWETSWLLSSCFMWPKLNKQVIMWVPHCVWCQRTKTR